MPAQSNFAFIETEWPHVYASSLRAEEYMGNDPRSSCFYARHAVEQLVEHIYQVQSFREPYRDDVAARVHDPQFRDLSPQGIIQKLDLIRKVGNRAVHGEQAPRPDVAMHVVRDLHHVLIWAAQRFSTTPDTVPVNEAFDPQLATRRQPMRHDELRKLAVRVQQEQEDYRRQLEASEAKARELEEKLAKVRAQIAQAQETKQVADTRDYDEATTRRDLIDEMLEEAGWTVTAAGSTDAPPHHAETEVRLREAGNEQTRYADYVLWGDDARPLAVVEAKRTSRNPDVGQEQARLYADALEAEHGQRPIIFYTNGYLTRIWDDRASVGVSGESASGSGYAPREIQSFLTKDELEWRIQSRRRRRSLTETSVKTEIVNRSYQKRAIGKIGEAFTEQRRAGLLVMATGTGKTRTVIALVDQMLRAGWVKRVLFLADRVALVNQAANAFKKHLPEEPPVNLVEERDQDGRIFISTYPTMLNRIKEFAEHGKGRFGPGYFDLVVVDEAHRSVYQKYGSIFDWFDSLLVGLTATPVDQVDRNTYLLFEQEPGVPTDAYPLEAAIADDYLVPARAVELSTRFLDRGIHYDELSEDEQAEWDELEWNDEGEVPDAVSSADMNRRLFNTDTVDTVLNELMLQGISVAGGDRLGKTIIFAKNQDHADFIYERFNHQYPMYGGKFARVISHRVEHAQRLIDAFSDPASEPHIAITVDMLDTGIDVPEVVNLLFFKPVFSKTKFWQMIGRGTRKRDNLFGPGDHKSEFLILDFCGNLEFFNADLPEREAARPHSLSERLFRHRIELLTTLQTGSTDLGVAVVDGVEYPKAHLEADLARAAQRHVQGLNVHNVQVRPHRQLVETYGEPPAWERLTPASAQEVAEKLGQLPSTAVKDSEEAKSFDLTVLRGQLAHITGDGPTFGTQRNKIQDIARSLLTKTNVPAIKEQARLLEEIAEDPWWEDATALMLEEVRRKVRELVTYADKTTWKPVHTTFTDELTDSNQANLHVITPGTDLQRFKEKTSRFLRQNLDNITLQKLRHNRQLTEQDLAMLEELLLGAGVGTREDIQAAAQEANGLGLFVRSLVGLDRGAVQKAFDDFIQSAHFTSDQLVFIQQVIDYLTANGAMSVEALYEPPLSDNGSPDAVIGDESLDSVVNLIDEIRRRAAPAVTGPDRAGNLDRIAN